MLSIKTNDDQYLDVNKEKLISINYFRSYLSDKFCDNKDIIELDYDVNIVKYFICDLYEKKQEIDKHIILEYMYFLNYVSFDKPILNLINKFDNYKSDINYILEVSNLYPQYKHIIQKKLNNYLFTYNELEKLEGSYK